MKRRAFLGFLGGAAASGPKLAAGIAENVAALAPPVPPMAAYGYSSGSVTPDEDWKARRIKELKAILSGRDPQIEHNEKMNRLYALETSERVRLDTLRSVSAVHKQRMLMDGARNRSQRIRHADAEWDLKRLLMG